jgi:hypothetical protein
MGLEDGTGTEGPCEMRIWSLESSEFQKNLNQKKQQFWMVMERECYHQSRLGFHEHGHQSEENSDIPSGELT